MVLKPERVLFAALAEDRDPYRSEIEYLFKSVRLRGGVLARAGAAALFIQHVDPVVVERLNRIEVTVQVVDPVSARRPHANKIRLLQAAGGWDYLVALDTDTVVVDDISTHVWGSEIAAKPADWSPLTLPQWDRLFSHFGLTLPDTRYSTSFHGMKIPPYFNSGVLIVPRQHARALHEAWLSYASLLEDVHDIAPEVQTHAFFTDQMALSLAIVGAGLPYRDLPLEMNFPTHRSVRGACNPETLTPRIIHYHHRIFPDGRLMPCDYQNINAALAMVSHEVSAFESAMGR
jgi:hypothetical protein